MRKLLLVILLVCFTICYGQTYKGAFGSYTLVTEQTMPRYVGSIQNNGTYNRVENYNPHYSATYNYNSAGPMKASGKHESGSATVTGPDGQIVTVTWTADSDKNGKANWTITYTYPDGTVEYDSYYGAFGSVKTYAQDKAKEKAEEYANNSYSSPIGSPSILVLLICIYCLYKCRVHLRDEK